MNLDRDKFDEIYDAGCWPSGITEDEAKILAFVLAHQDGLHYVGESASGYSCECTDEVWEKHEDENYDDPYRFQERLKRLNSKIYRFEPFEIDREVKHDQWKTFYFDEVNELYRDDHVPVSVFMPFFKEILDSNPDNLKEMILNSDEAWRGFCVVICPKCQRWSICD